MRARKVAGVGQSSVARPRFIMKRYDPLSPIAITGVSTAPYYSILSKWLLLSWLLHKQKREFSDTNFEVFRSQS